MNESTNETMGAIIARRRKELGLTQEQLAGALNISYQAVSKWENELSSPDISTLPLLADTLGLSLDELFGREAIEAKTTEPRQETADAEPEAAGAEPAALIPVPGPVRQEGAELPWPDDNTLHAVLFVGHRLVGQEGLGKHMFSRRQISFQYEGPALNVQSDFDVTVEGEVRGSVTAEGDVSCEAVYGSVKAGGDVSCGNVSCDVSAGGDVSCDNVSGHIQAGGDVNCDNVDGNINAGSDIKCGDVEGSVSAAGDVSCGNVGGDVRAEGDLSCGNVGGAADNGEFSSNLKDKKRGFSFELKL